MNFLCLFKHNYKVIDRKRIDRLASGGFLTDAVLLKCLRCNKVKVGFSTIEGLNFIPGPPGLKDLDYDSIPS